ncbi:Fe-S protein assembly co-chaperone HscB [Buchnera aphidicola]|uniref:Fe-S protein assembly co-chaperone HscB n=1 Tax=Buchnera aphidicola TaxID=9 RepID=UPI0034646530
MDYFQLFNLPKKIEINKKLLSKNFYKLQLIYHPDLFIHASCSEKKNILKKSININKGYKILRHFSTRAIYLLSLNGININQKKISFNNHIFLSKYFSLYEELDYVKNHDHNKEAYNSFNKKVQNQIQKYKDNIIIQLNNKNWIASEKIILKLLFVLKIEKSLKK